MDKEFIYRHCFLPPLGERVTVYWWNDRLAGLYLGEASNEKLERSLMRHSGAHNVADCPHGEETEAMSCLQRELAEYYAGERAEFTPAPALLGTEFQRKIWEALLAVPYGSTVSYSQLAAAAGVRGDRACGSAVGSNPIAIVVPCHRVLPKSGKMGNYSTGRGPVTKRELLELESKGKQGGCGHWK